MQSTLTLKDADPHDIFVIEPEVVRALRASKASSDLAHDPTDAPVAPQAPVSPQAHVAPDVSARPQAPRVEPMFRPAAVDDIKIPSERIERPGDRPATGKLSKRVFMGLFALTSAIAAAAWQHYGDTAKAVIANHVPPFVLAWSAPTEKPATAEQPSAPAVQAAAADQGTATDQAAAEPPPPAQPAQAAAPAVAAAAPESTQLLQSMARDLASMGQQIEQLKASIDQLKAGQDQLSRDMAKTSDARTAEARTSGTMTSEQSLRPRVPAPPMRATAAPVRKPKPAYAAPLPPAAPAYPQTAAAPPPAAVAPVPAPQSQATAEDGGPLVRPPMPLR
jgi:hypothetical protein